MKIVLRSTDRDGEVVHGRDDMAAEVVDDNWVNASIEAAWAMCRYTGGPITAIIKDTGERICTVEVVIHDDPEPVPA